MSTTKGTRTRTRKAKVLQDKSTMLIGQDPGTPEPTEGTPVIGDAAREMPVVGLQPVTVVESETDPQPPIPEAVIVHGTGSGQATLADGDALANIRRRAMELASKPTRKTPKDCACGCGEKTKGADFKPGHNGKALSKILTELRAGIPEGGVTIQ